MSAEPDPPLTDAEAHAFAVRAAEIVRALQDDDRPLDYAVKKSVMDRADALVLLSALLSLIARHYPSVLPDPGMHELVEALAQRYFRRVN